MVCHMQWCGDFPNTLKGAQKLMSVLENFCMRSKLSANNYKIKVKLVKTQNNDKPCTTYNNAPLET